MGYFENPKSWFDFPVTNPIDPRGIVQSASFMDQAGTYQGASFDHSSTFLKSVTWANPPLSVSPRVTGTIPNVSAVNPADFEAVERAASWTAAHAMASTNSQLPICVQGTFFLIAHPKYFNNLYLDWAAGVTSTDIQLSMSQNSLTSGDFANASLGTIPAFVFPTTATYGGTGRVLQLVLRQKGEYMLGLRIHDSVGNWSMYQMHCIVS